MRISLAETDRRWRYILAGRTYHGEAINPKSLSIFERYALRLHKVLPASFLVHVLDLPYARPLLHSLMQPCLCSPACAVSLVLPGQPLTISHMLHFASYLPSDVLACDQSISLSSVSLSNAGVLQNYDRKLDAEESLDDLRELGLEVKDARNGNYLAPGSGGVPVSDSARGAAMNGKEGAAGFTNGFGNPATIGKPLAGQVAHV